MINKDNSDDNKYYIETNNEIHRRESVEEDLNLRLRQQEAMAWVGEYAIRAQDIDALFQETARLVCETLDTEYCKILELLPDGSELLLRAGVGWREGLVGHIKVGAGTDSQAGYTLLTEEPVIVSDLRTELRFSGEKLLYDHHAFSGMTVVIPGKEKPFGVLGVHTSKPKQYMPYDTRFIKGIAGILGSAVERFRAEKELRRSRDDLAIILNGVTEGITAQDSSGKLVFANQAAAIFLGYDTAQDLMNATNQEVLNHFDLFGEDGNPLPVEALPGRQVLKGAPMASARINYRIRKTGEDRWSITDATPILDAEGSVIQTVNIFRDISEIVRMEEHRKLLVEAGELLASSLDYETTLANVTQLVVKNLADWCSVHLLTEENEPYRISVAHKDPAKVAQVLELERRYPPDPQTESATTRVLRTGQAEFIPELPDSVLVAAARDAEHLEILRALQLHSGVVLPLIARGRTLGALTLVWAESGRKYTQSEVNLAQELANRAALAIENARLYQEAQSLNTNLEQRVAKRTHQLELSTNQLLKEMEERKKAETELEETHRRLFESVEAERLQLSQELHDGPIQELYGVALELESIKSMLEPAVGPADEVGGNPADGLDELESLGENVQAIIQMLRTVCSDLRPPVLTQFGLEKAIRSHLSKLQEAHPELHITATLTNDSNRLTERTRLALYRVYQNAISNVIRHAQAKNIDIEFNLAATHILLQIQDDGRGFSMPIRRIELVRSGHFGLAGIAERVEALGGQVVIESAPGQGTIIRVDLPKEE